MSDKYKSVESIIRELRGHQVVRTTTSMRAALMEVAAKKKKPDADKDGVPNWADKKPGKDDRPETDKDDNKKPDGDKDGVPDWADKKKGKDDKSEKKPESKGDDEEVKKDSEEEAPKKDGEKKGFPPKKGEKEEDSIKTGGKGKVDKAELKDDDKDAELALDKTPTKVVFNPPLNKDIKEGMGAAVKRMGAKVLPGVGTAYGVYDTYARMKEKDYVGAGIAAAGTVTSVIPGGGAATLGLDAVNLARDAKAGKFDSVLPSSNSSSASTTKPEVKMTEKKKSVAEALAEVQRNVNAKRLEETQARWEQAEPVEEGAVAQALEFGAGVAGNVAKRLGAVKSTKEIEATAAAQAAAKARAPAPAPAKPAQPKPGNDNVPNKGPANDNVPGKAPANTNVAKPAAPAGKAPTPSTPAKPSTTPAKPATATSTPKVGTTAKVGAAATAAAAAVAGGAAMQKDADAKPAAATDDNDKKAAETKPAADSKPPVASGGKQTFAQAFKQARADAAGGTGKFKYDGKDYQTNIKGSGTAAKPQEKYQPAKTLKDVGDKTEAPKPAEAPKANTATKTESLLVTRFMALEAMNSSNPFQAAKKLQAEAFKDTAKVQDPDMKAPAPKNKTEYNKPAVAPIKGGSSTDPDFAAPRHPSSPKNPNEIKFRKEEVEEIEEVSSKTLLSYKSKASKQYSALHDKIVKANGRASADDVETYKNREKGIAKADKKILSREEVEEIDEVSKGKLDSYTKGAEKEWKDGGLLYPSARKSANRGKGIKLAHDKSVGKAKVNASEEVEFSAEELAHIESIINKD